MDAKRLNYATEDQLELLAKIKQNHTALYNTVLAEYQRFFSGYDPENFTENEAQDLIDTIRSRMRDHDRFFPASFVLYDPDGNEYPFIQNLRLFCDEHGLSYSSIQRVINRKAEQVKGWTVSFLDCKTYVEQFEKMFGSQRATQKQMMYLFGLVGQDQQRNSLSLWKRVKQEFEDNYPDCDLFNLSKAQAAFLIDRMKCWTLFVPYVVK